MKKPTIYIFYCLEFRRSEQSKWRRPDGPLDPVRGRGWELASHDYFDCSPGTWAGSEFTPRWEAVARDAAAVKEACWLDGWFNLKHAQMVMRHVERRDSLGDYDNQRDGVKIQTVRREFRICRRHFLDYREEVTTSEPGDDSGFGNKKPYVIRDDRPE